MKSLVANHHTIDLSLVFNTLPGSSVLLLPDAPKFTIVSATEEYTKATGKTLADLRGRGLFERFPGNPEDPNLVSKKTVHASLEFVLTHKEPHQLPLQRYDIFHHQHNLFEERYWNAYTKPVLDEDGDVLYLIHTADDVTCQIKQQQNEQKLKSIERYYNVFMNAPVIIAIVKGDDYIIDLANEGMLEVWGKGNEVIGKPLLQAVPELEGQGYLELLAEVRRTGISYSTTESQTTIIRNGKKENLYFDFTYKPYYDHEDDIVASGVIGFAYEVTEKVRARQRFKNVIEQAVNPILILSGEDMILEIANEALFELWNVDKSVLGKPFLEILPDMKDQGFLELLQQVYYTGKPYRGIEKEVIFTNKNGHQKPSYLNFTYQPYLEADGSISGVLVLVDDVTEQVIIRKQIEVNREELRKSRERFELVSKATQDAIWDWDVQTNELHWNEAVYNMFGYDQQVVENVDEWWTEHIHPDDREWVVQSVQNEIDNQSSLWEGEYSFRCADGSYRIVYDRGFIQYDANGKPTRMIGCMQDITERKQNEFFLRESKQKWQELANTMPVIVWTADAQGFVNFLNNGWYNFTGLSYEQSKGAAWVSVLHPDDVDRCLEFWNNARANNQFYETEVRYKNKDGFYRWMLIRGVPILDDEGKAHAWYGTSTDIHEQKMLAENLENLIEERTAELKRSNSNLEEFAYAASHDLKEPIRKIHFFSDRLKESLSHKLDIENFRLFDRLQNASKRMSTLIDDLLSFSQVTKGTQEYEQVNLSERVHFVIEDLELEIQEKSAIIEVESLPIITGNKLQFQQLFQNLVSNALKYSKPGTKPEIKISSALVDSKDFDASMPKIPGNKKFNLIEISDNGIGFEQIYADRIFNVFTRLHGNSEFKGSGVGLSIVRKVVENHHGYIWAESELGKGSKFKILLPVTN